MALPLRISPRPALAGARLPPHARAVLEALRLDRCGVPLLRALDDGGFRDVLRFSDPAQLTLLLNHLHRDALPGWVRARIDSNLRDYGSRFARLQAALNEIAATFARRGLEFAVLKGLSHVPEFTPHALLRVQGDIDLWCRPESVEDGRLLLRDLGYRPVGHANGRHLAPMVRERHWEWRGDYFASDLPIAVELHHRLWDHDMEFVAAVDEEQIWARRNGPVLCLPDTLAFAALHFLMHLLHGDPRLQRGWEIANFLDRHAGDEAFWAAWQELHPPQLRRLEAIVFELTAGWFGAGLAPAADAEIESLPRDIRLWLERCALSPLEGLFQPNKDEIWLQLSLLESRRDKCAVFLRRVLPVQAARGNGAPARRRLEFLGARLRHHARALLPALAGGLRWWWLRAQPGAGFLRFQAASVLFCLGMSAYFLLYNLYMLGLGYHEDVLGRVSGLLSLGTLCGTLPAAAIARRAGLRKTLLLAVLGASLAGTLRLAYSGQVWLLACAFLHGLFMSLWAVSFAPAVAGLSSERTRQSAFTLACAAGMSIGILGGLVGGRLPGLLGGPRNALLAAAAFSALGAWPALRLRFAEPAEEKARVYPQRRDLGRFLVALGCWSLAVGGFNPFFNAYLARFRMGAERIGTVYSFAQIAQVTAVLAGRAVFRRLGEVRGVAAMQTMTGGMLLLLAASGSGSMATLAYIAYGSCQYMSEPAILKVLMNRAKPEERSGASALFFLASSLAASLAAVAGGAAISRFGYGPSLLVCGFLAMVGAFLFRRL